MSGTSPDLQISLIPYVCGAGASLPGCEQGPLDFALRGLHEKLQKPGRDVWWSVDPETLYAGPYGATAHHDLPRLKTPERDEIVSWHVRVLADMVADDVRAGAFPVTIGGDHSMAAGSVTGLSRVLGPDVKIGLLWLDAHADINTPETSPSGALHGMPVADLLGLDQSNRFGLSHDAPVLSPQRVVYAGLRDVDPGEHDFIRTHGILALNMADLRGVNVSTALQSAMRSVPDVDVWAVSLDLDGFDPEFVPAVGTPVDGGFDRDSLIAAIGDIVRAFDVRLFEIAEHNPTLKGASANMDAVLATLDTVISAKSDRRRLHAA